MGVPFPAPFSKPLPQAVKEEEEKYNTLIGEFTPRSVTGGNEPIPPGLENPTLPTPPTPPVTPTRGYSIVPLQSSSTTLGRPQDKEYIKEQVGLGTQAIGVQQQRALAIKQALEAQKQGLNVYETEMFGKPIEPGLFERAKSAVTGTPIEQGARVGGVWDKAIEDVKEQRRMNQETIDKFTKPIQPSAAKMTEPGMEPGAVAARYDVAALDPRFALGVPGRSLAGGRTAAGIPIIPEQGKTPQARPAIDVDALKTKYDAANDALEESINKLKSYKIDPNRRFKTAGGALAGFIGFIGVGLASFAQGISKTGVPFGTNAMKMLNDAADRDLEAQRLEMSQLLQTVNLTEKQKDNLYKQWKDTEGMRKDAILRGGQLAVAETSVLAQKALAASKLAENRALLEAKIVDTQVKAADTILGIQGQISGEKHKEFIEAQPRKQFGTHEQIMADIAKGPSVAKKPISPTLSKELRGWLDSIKEINQVVDDFVGTDPNRFETIRRSTALQDAWQRRMEQLINKRRMMVTGQAASEQELKRITDQYAPGKFSGFLPWATAFNIFSQEARDNAFSIYNQYPDTGPTFKQYLPELRRNPIKELEIRMRNKATE